MMYTLAKWGGEAGGEWVFWYEFRATIGDLIDKHNIEPVEGKFLPQLGYPITASPPRPWPCGGIKAAHVHYGDEVFPLNEDQWNVFTRDVIEECTKRLQVAKTVPLTVESVAAIGGAVASLAILPSENRQIG